MRVLTLRVFQDVSTPARDTLAHTLYGRPLQCWLKRLDKTCSQCCQHGLLPLWSSCGSLFTCQWRYSCASIGGTACFDDLRFVTATQLYASVGIGFSSCSCQILWEGVLPGSAALFSCHKTLPRFPVSLPSSSHCIPSQLFTSTRFIIFTSTEALSSAAQPMTTTIHFALVIDLQQSSWRRGTDSGSKSDKDQWRPRSAASKSAPCLNSFTSNNWRSKSPVTDTAAPKVAKDPLTIADWRRRST
jgi:hypothetical protein